MVGDQAAPHGLGLLIANGPDVPEAEFASGTVDGMARVDLHFESSLGEDFAGGGPELVGLGKREKGQGRVGWLHLW